MNALRTHKNTRKWVFLVLLAFMGQMVGSMAHGKVSVETSSGAFLAANSGMNENAHSQPSNPHCHGDSQTSSQVIETDSIEHDGSKSSCCEDGCSMTACHSVSATLNTFRFVLFSFSAPSNFIEPQLAVVGTIGSLYRPPILG